MAMLLSLGHTCAAGSIARIQAPTTSPDLREICGEDTPTVQEGLSESPLSLSKDHNPDS
jgi:hypothetical protein